MDESQIQKPKEGEQPKEPVKEAPAADPAEGRVKKINEAADRLEAAEKRLAEREQSLRESQALNRIGGSADAGNPKLTPEEEEASKAQKAADEMTNAFK